MRVFSGMLCAWLDRQGLTTAVIPEIYAYFAGVAISMLVLYGFMWLVLVAVYPGPKLPRFSVPVIASWTYLLGFAIPLWESSKRDVAFSVLIIPALFVLTLLRCRFSLHASWMASVLAGLGSWAACFLAAISMIGVAYLFNIG